MTDLVEFLRARLDEDEAAAWAVMDWAEAPRDHGLPWHPTPADGRVLAWGLTCVGAAATPTVAEYIARHDPARVLREVETKRQILDLYEETHASVVRFREERRHGAIVMSVEAALTALHLVIQRHAVVHSDHPDYDPEWAPSPVQ